MPAPIEHFKRISQVLPKTGVTSDWWYPCFLDEQGFLRSILLSIVVAWQELQQAFPSKVLLLAELVLLHCFSVDSATVTLMHMPRLRCRARVAVTKNVEAVKQESCWAILLEESTDTMTAWWITLVVLCIQ